MVFRNGVQKSKAYGKIYFPYYNPDVKIISSITPEIYNQFGEKMEVFFLRDTICSHSPYGQRSKYFLWDRFNIGLDTHFYSHQAMLETMGSPTKKYGYLMEPRSITPNDYKLFDRHKGLAKEFTSILTYDERLLDSLPNANFFPFSIGISTGILAEKAYDAKNKDISIVCSNKKATRHQKIRYNCAHVIKREKLGDVFGQFDGSKWLENKTDSLKDYRYHIAIENGVYDYYFTEKIIDCFVSMSVPIYLGARKINEFFNMDGIILINEQDIDNLPEILKQCNEKDYKSRLPAIKDNYQRALKYRNMDDYLYEMLFKQKSKIKK